MHGRSKQTTYKLGNGGYLEFYGPFPFSSYPLTSFVLLGHSLDRLHDDNDGGT